MPRSVDLSAEMVANVLQVYVDLGDSVSPGDTVVLLESMKMEIPVLVDVSGTVQAVNVEGGDVVQEGDVLVSVSVDGGRGGAS
jgi:acetyl-CoA carboxylase biotin carboxyl carrier protein